MLTEPTSPNLDASSAPTAAVPLPEPATYAPRQVSILRKIISSISAALRSDPPLKGWARTAQEALNRSGRLPCGPDDWEALQQWARDHAKQERIVNSSTREAAYVWWEKHQRAHSDAMTETGETDGHVLSREDCDKRFRLIHDAAKAREVELYRQHINIARRISATVADVLKDIAADTEHSEKEQHKIWDAPYVGPSGLVQHLRKTERIVRGMTAADESSVSPVYFFPYLPFSE